MKTIQEIRKFLEERIHVEPGAKLEADSFALKDGEYPEVSFIRRGFRIVYDQPLVNVSMEESSDYDDIIALIGRTSIELEKRISLRFWDFIDESFSSSFLDYSRFDVKIRFSPRLQFMSRVSPYMSGDDGLVVGLNLQSLFLEKFTQWEYHCVCIVNDTCYRSN